jgi:class 3 adenylate cyclase
MERRLAAILVADMVGYSRMMYADEANTLEALRACRKEIFEPQVAEQGGRAVKCLSNGQEPFSGQIHDGDRGWSRYVFQN